MPATRAELFAFLDGLGIAHETIEHPAVFTVAESAHLRARIQGGKSKNLFLKDKKGRLFLFTAEDEAEIDLKTLHRKLGAQGRFSFASAGLLEEVWGVRPGSVTPFGAINDAEGRVTVGLDAGLLAKGRVNFHPLENTATTAVAAEDLVRFLRETGHEPVIVER
ncbi:prolyl-tRNA synthetase associated domain-containing protein [Chenggangzhangella methanolivorans]|uniref:Prolyl-tRNA synthetase associated domain-containing protein n=1 Tax=Chenggangzhangella methanolivorans TaxID=1437009 RepID=A0A9E6R948_9HYPH|nr:prolyl-tRNA synthetase associated domain-containing protein [Chenggangzhangella methanolivorans]QZN98902.1 prolyl-tRNA synthetase associated domain-containing protein [Chenggangzhangella methanolivorans]